MAQPILFGEVLEVADKLSQEEQETLIFVLQRRLAERRRKLVATEIQEARQEFSQGHARPTTVDDLKSPSFTAWCTE